MKTFLQKINFTDVIIFFLCILVGYCIVNMPKTKEKNHSDEKIDRLIQILDEWKKGDLNEN